MYQVIVERKAQREMEVLPDDALQNVVHVIGNLVNTPRPQGVKKLIGKDGWRIRVNDYRVLYTIDDKHKLISIYRVKHRKDAYR